MSGDTVRVIVTSAKRGPRAPDGKIVEIVARAAQRFVGTYKETDDEADVRLDGGVLEEPIYVGDAGAKSAMTGDKVVVEMLRFPSLSTYGEGVVTEVLGPRGSPGVDLLTALRQFELPDEFPDAVMEEARQQAAQFAEQPLSPDRRDFTVDDGHDRSARRSRLRRRISLSRDDKGYWNLGAHADVAAFVPVNSRLDREARLRGLDLPARPRAADAARTDFKRAGQPATG